MRDITEDPFAVYSPESLDSVPSDRLVEMFVDKNSKLPAVKRQKHSFVWGPRGSGKSMMFQYLEPECQFIQYDSPEAFFASEKPFIGIYVSIREGNINVTELDIHDEQTSKIITEHLLNLSISEQVITTLTEQFPDDYLSDESIVEFADTFVGFFDSGSIAPSKQAADASEDKDERPFEWLQELIAAEKGRIMGYIRNYHFTGETYGATTSGYHDFLLPMLQAVQRLVGHEEVPIYLLLDDAFYLWESQQKIINTWIANRDQETVCVKASSIFEKYETFETVGRGKIESTHDYTEIWMDELYTHDPKKYLEKVRRIANKRLEIADQPTRDIEEFLPANPREQELLEEIREECEPRLARARLFQQLAEKNNEKSYAGFENVVHTSSGIVRFFLDLCSSMFDEYADRGNDRNEIEDIPPSVQDNVLKSNSEELLSEEPRKAEKDLQSERAAQLDKLVTLVHSIGKLFYRRLHDPELKKPRTSSFSVNGEIPDESDLDEVLELGREMQYLHYTTAASRDPGGRDDCYMLDKRLTPFFKIDPIGSQDRIPLSPRDLEIGCKDPKQFIKRVLGADEYQEPLDSFGRDDR